MTDRADRPRCSCCGGEVHPAPFSPAIGRRTVIRGLLALPILSATPAWAQLLDPSKLGTSRVGAGNLPPASARPQDWVGPGYARDMAASVTSAIISLIRAYGNVADQIGKLQAQEKELAAKLDQAIRDKASKLEEYRQGLFCSGCGQTRSEILAKGEQFPHPGQTIIRPTAEQIAAKERELQAVIDNLDKQHRDARSKLGSLDPDIDAIRNQLFEGMLLWRTADAMERGLIRLDDNFEGQDYVRQRETISRQVAGARRDGENAQEIYQFRSAIADLETWSRTLEQLESRRNRQIDARAAALAKNDDTAARQMDSVRSVSAEVAGRITAFGYAGYLTTLPVLMGRNGDGVNGGAAGYMFRMGKYDKAGWGEILPRVAEFCGRANSLIVGGMPGYSPSASQELAQIDRTIGELEPKLAEAIEARRRAEEEAALARQQEEAQRQAEAENPFGDLSQASPGPGYR